MLELKKPAALRSGDTVAAVSLSWGAAGEPGIRWRYELGKQRLERDFGLRVVEMPHTLAPADFVDAHPEARAADLMAAFADPHIKGIINVIGGKDSVRMLPYLDLDLIARNPKVFCGYSDGNTTDYICMAAGFRSFYGAHILNDFGEPGQMPPYTADHVRRMLMGTDPVGDIAASPVYSGKNTPWRDREARRVYIPDTGYRCLQPGVASGPLIGGCFEVFTRLEGTPIAPPPDAYDGAILFYEVCGTPTEEAYTARLRKFAQNGCLGRIAGLLMGKPLGGDEEQAMLDRATRQVLREFGRQDLPVLSNGSFGHCSPSGVIPLGARATIDCDAGRFCIDEATVE